ncbi:MAG TPA: DNA recombination protein RmuC [Candidatus Saccharimonadales bacterium]|nr:DNA recombination protein RmuC [Candidatus Saccharimonadales bacterium]
MSAANIFLLIIIFLAGLGGIAFLLISQMKKMREEMKGTNDTVLMEWLKNMQSNVQNEFKEHRSTLDTQMSRQREAMNQQTKLIWERLDNSTEVIRNVQKQLGGIEEFGKDMKDLSNVLKSPKLRGGLGEQFLYDILQSFLPKDLFKTQYKFKSGDTCDVVIFTERGIIPVDSKFPMENFKAMLTCDSDLDREKFKKMFTSDVKKRIEEISSKYILPDEGTTSQAVMYIPSETVYYEILVNNPQIEDYAKNKNVIMASPNTLSYFLKVLLVAYQQHELQKHADEILKALGGIKVEAVKFNEDLGVLERHITNSYNGMTNVKTHYSKLFGKIENVQTIEPPEVKPLQIPLE